MGLGALQQIAPVAAGVGKVEPAQQGIEVHGRRFERQRHGGVGAPTADLIFNRSQGVGGFGYSLIERGLIAARAVWFYLCKLLWPVDLGVIHPHWEVRTARDRILRE